jgi:fluoroacetyl-CoA thioesterase
MKTTLHPGLVLELSYRVADARPSWSRPASQSERSRMPPSASDTMLGLIRWACMEAMRPHAQAGEHSVGLETEILSAAEMAPGQVAHVEVLVERVEGRKVWFRVKAYDGARPIGEGTHERFVMDRERLSPRPARQQPRQHAAQATRSSGPRGRRRSVG